MLCSGRVGGGRTLLGGCSPRWAPAPGTPEGWAEVCESLSAHPAWGSSRGTFHPAPRGPSTTSLPAPRVFTQHPCEYFPSAHSQVNLLPPNPGFWVYFRQTKLRHVGSESRVNTEPSVACTGEPRVGTKPASAGGRGRAAQGGGRLQALLTGLKMPCPTSEWVLEQREVLGCIQLDCGGQWAPGALALTLPSGMKCQPPSAALGFQDVSAAPSPDLGEIVFLAAFIPCVWGRLLSAHRVSERTQISVLSRPRNSPG